MSELDWLMLAAIPFVVLMGYANRLAYRHGIWDGAFNHFLPVVRSAMRQYDDRRAEKVLRTPDVNDRLGSWLSAALDDPDVCEEMKADIRAWFEVQS